MFCYPPLHLRLCQQLGMFSPQVLVEVENSSLQLDSRVMRVHVPRTVANLIFLPASGKKCSNLSKGWNDERSAKQAAAPYCTNTSETQEERREAHNRQKQVKREKTPQSR